MDIAQIENSFKEVTDIRKTAPNEWRIFSDATFTDGKSIEIYVTEIDKKWYYTDKKQTLKYMNELYELKSPDVQSCMKNVLKIYGFSLKAGAIFAEIPSPSTIKEKYFDMIMCIAQLANMYAFFDEP